MKIALINGSPKMSGSASGSILQDLRSPLEAEEATALEEGDVLVSTKVR